MDERDRRRCRAIYRLEQLDEFDLPFAFAEDAEDPAGARIEGGEQIERAFANVLVLDGNGLISRPSRTIARCPRSWLQ